MEKELCSANQPRSRAKGVGTQGLGTHLGLPDVTVRCFPGAWSSQVSRQATARGQKNVLA